MLITILFAAIFLIGLITIIVCKIVNARTYAVTPDWLDVGSVVCVMGGLLCVLGCSVLLIANAATINSYYEEMVYEKEVLEYRLDKFEAEGYVTGNELLYTEITEFNNELRSIKRWANNPWTNWFNNWKIADNIDYIDYTNGGGGEK